MAKFQVTYNTQTTETVEADCYKEVRGWIIFMVEAEDEHGLPELNQETLRIKGAHVQRVERLGA